MSALQSCREPEPATSALLALRPDFATHQLRQPSCDGEPETGAAVSSRRRRIGLLKRLEQLANTLCWDAHSGVDHLKAHQQCAVCFFQQCRAAVLTLTGGEAHHATRVLRVREGDRVAVLDGAGQQLDCTVAGLGRDRVSLQVHGRRSAAPLPCAITLLQAIPKGKLFESIVQKATELGVARIVPILSERVVTHLDADSAETKAEKWQQVAVEAIKQCGSAWLPKVEVPLTPKEFLARRETFELPLLGSLETGSRPPRYS